MAIDASHAAKQDDRTFTVELLSGEEPGTVLAAGHREFLDAFALLVLAHESQHAAGIAGEAAAECRGMQTMAEAGTLLGVPRSYARRLAQDFWTFYPRRPKPYYSRECRDGGALDMRPASHRWP